MSAGTGPTESGGAVSGTGGSVAGGGALGTGGSVAGGGALGTGGVSVNAGGVASVNGGGAGGMSSGGMGTSVAGSDSCGSASPGASFEESCLACAKDACERCLCTECTDQLQKCGSTSGCGEIIQCIRESQCTGADCYCGTFDAFSCAAGQSNGPCKGIILEAPGAREPTLVNASAGPASDAALAISACRQPGKSCAAACPDGS